MRRFVVLFVLALMAISNQAKAEDDQFVIWADSVDRLLQNPDESEEQFTIRVFQRFRAFTKETGFEASGNLCRSKDGRMGVSIFTWYAHFSSPYMGGCPNEAPIMGDFIHSHPEAGSYSMTKQDFIDANQRRKLFKVSASKKVHVSRWSAQQFSPPDYDIGPGYLVSDDVVLYQHGRGTSRVVMRLPALPRQ